MENKPFFNMIQPVGFIGLPCQKIKYPDLISRYLDMVMRGEHVGPWTSFEMKNRRMGLSEEQVMKIKTFNDCGVVEHLVGYYSGGRVTKWAVGIMVDEVKLKDGYYMSVGNVVVRLFGLHMIKLMKELLNVWTGVKYRIANYKEADTVGFGEEDVVQKIAGSFLVNHRKSAFLPCDECGKEQIIYVGCKWHKKCMGCRYHDIKRVSCLECDIVYNDTKLVCHYCFDILVECKRCKQIACAQCRGKDQCKSCKEKKCMKCVMEYSAEYTVKEVQGGDASPVLQNKIIECKHLETKPLALTKCICDERIDHGKYVAFCVICERSFHMRCVGKVKDPWICRMCIANETQALEYAENPQIKFENTWYSVVEEECFCNYRWNHTESCWWKVEKFLTLVKSFVYFCSVGEDDAYRIYNCLLCKASCCRHKVCICPKRWKRVSFEWFLDIVGVECRFTQESLDMIEFLMNYVQNWHTHNANYTTAILVGFFGALAVVRMAWEDEETLTSLRYRCKYRQGRQYSTFRDLLKQARLDFAGCKKTENIPLVLNKCKCRHCIDDQMQIDVAVGELNGGEVEHIC